MSNIFNIAKPFLNGLQTLWTYRSLTTLPQLKLNFSADAYSALIEMLSINIYNTIVLIPPEYNLFIVGRITLFSGPDILRNMLQDIVQIDVHTVHICPSKEIFSCTIKLTDLISISHNFFGIKCTFNTDEAVLTSSTRRVYDNADPDSSIIWWYIPKIMERNAILSKGGMLESIFSLK